jgi:hypothetical protein
VQLPTPRDPTLLLPFFADREHGFDAEPRWWRKLVPDRPGRSLIPLTLAIALLTGAGFASVTQSRAAHDVRVLSLSAAPPSAANASGERTVTLTATGLPAHSRAYAVVVSTTASPATDRREVVADAGGGWTGDVVVRGGERTEVKLFEAGAAAPARTLVIAAG